LIGGDINSITHIVKSILFCKLFCKAKMICISKGINDNNQFMGCLK